uniref:Uncharacterized protein n=1 Tax=Salix viminalis TaxID=40686 RepID=A0A6N2NLD7_SALVM
MVLLVATTVCSIERGGNEKTTRGKRHWNDCFPRLSCYTAFIFGRTSHFIATRTTNPSHQSRIPFWRRSFEQPGNDSHLSPPDFAFSATRLESRV